MIQKIKEKIVYNRNLSSKTPLSEEAQKINEIIDFLNK